MKLRTLLIGVLFLLLSSGAWAQSSSFYPTLGTFGTWAFEDLWPARGDYDFNDLVVRYRLQFVQDTSVPAQVTQIKIALQVTARGAELSSGFGIRLPISAALPGLSARFGAGCDWTSLVPESGVAQASFVLFQDTAAVLPMPEGCVFSNTDPGCATAQNPGEFTLVVDVPAGHGVSLTTLAEGIDPFLFRTSDRTHEVHLPGFAPTERANPALFGTEDDATACSGDGDACTTPTGHYYMTSDNLPWALDVPVTWIWPAERALVLDAYPLFADWATHGGRDPASVGWYDATPVAGKAWSGTLVCENPCAGSPCMDVTCPGEGACTQASICESGACLDAVAKADFTSCGTDQVCLQGQCTDTLAPDSISGLTAWFDASTGVTSDANGRVSLWQDRTGQGHNASQATLSLRPTLMADGIYFDGVLKYLYSSAPINIGTVVMKVKLVGTAFAGVSGSASLFFMNASCKPTAATYGLSGISATTSFQTASSGEIRFVSAMTRVDGVTTTNVSPFEGVHVISGRSSPVSDFGSLELGGGGICKPSYPFKGYMQHMIFYDRILTESELHAVESYLETL